MGLELPLERLGVHRLSAPMFLLLVEKAALGGSRRGAVPTRKVEKAGTGMETEMGEMEATGDIRGLAPITIVAAAAAEAAAIYWGQAFMGGTAETVTAPALAAREA